MLACCFLLTCVVALASSPIGTWTSNAKNGTESYVVTLVLSKDQTWKMHDPKTGDDPQYSTGKWSLKGSKLILLNKWQIENHKTVSSLTFSKATE
jgi:hypothetical protein